mgnify:CR=1 FL=1
MTRRNAYYRRPENYVAVPYKAEHLAYLAGIIDGEGCFWIGKLKQKERPLPQWRGLLKIDNTDKKLFEWIDQYFGGTSSARTRSTSSRKFEREIHTWTFTGDRLMNICEQVLPYLVIKKEHCENMIKFRKTFNHKLGTWQVSDETNKIRQECLEASRKLNSRWYLHPLKHNSDPNPSPLLPVS